MQLHVIRKYVHLHIKSGILFVFFCAFEPIDFIFWIDRFFVKYFLNLLKSPSDICVSIREMEHFLFSRKKLYSATHPCWCYWDGAFLTRHHQRDNNCTWYGSRIPAEWNVVRLKLERIHGTVERTQFSARHARSGICGGKWGGVITPKAGRKKIVKKQIERQRCQGFPLEEYIDGKEMVEIVNMEKSIKRLASTGTWEQSANKKNDLNKYANENLLNYYGTLRINHHEIWINHNEIIQKNYI